MIKQFHITGYVKYPIDLKFQVGDEWQNQRELHIVNEIEARIKESVKLMAGLGQADLTELRVQLS